MDGVQEAIESRGWAGITWWDGRDIHDLNARYGDIFGRHPLEPEARTLRPHDKTTAKPGTMSSFTGYDQQPPHTDKAHFGTPPRYIVLHCDDAGSVPCPTLIWELDWDALEAACPALLTTPEWLIRRSAAQQFYGQVLSFTRDGRSRLRFDPLCMLIPGRASAAQDALNLLLANASMKTCEWQRGDTLLVDNWRIMHARGTLPPGASTRRLLRWTSGENGGLGNWKAKSKSLPLWAAGS